jgi:hypothetical protein
MLELSYKKLIAWQKAIAMLPLVYGVCQKLPKEERFNLVSQMKRAALLFQTTLLKDHQGKQKQKKTASLKFDVLRLWKLILALPHTLSLNLLPKKIFHY